MFVVAPLLPKLRHYHVMAEQHDFQHIRNRLLADMPASR
jgi:hypothetical protein